MSSYDRYPPRYSWSAYLWPLLLLLALAAVLTWRFWPRTPWAGLDPNAVPRAGEKNGTFRMPLPFAIRSKPFSSIGLR
jgi:hypothetical protein